MTVRAGIAFSPPANFEPDELMFSMRAPAPLFDPRAVKQLPVRPNLIVFRRRVKDSSSLELLVGETAAELSTSVPGIQNLATEALQFQDASEGVLLSFNYAARGASVEQLQAMRLDDDFFTTITVTVQADLPASDRLQYVACLASCNVTGPVEIER